MQNLRADAGGKGISISALRSDADFTAVMRYPQLVLKYDWPALARETGVYTNEKCGRERAWRNRAISRTHAQNVTRARTNSFQNMRARAQPDVQAQPGTHGTGACSHMRVRAECARALTRY